MPVAGDAAVRGSADTQNAESGSADGAATALVAPHIATIAAAGGYLSLLALEIDRFALIAHLHGAEAAEMIARHLGVSIEASLHREERCLRTGPGQFAVLVPDGPDVAERFARAAAAGFRRASWSHLGEVTVSAAAAQRFSAESVASWWARVESALAQAKAGGGGQVVIDRRRGGGDPTAAPGLHLQWQARFECGEPTIDRQHRELFQRSEEVLDSMRHGSARLVSDLEHLIAGIVEHFAEEERILEQRAYPDLAAHRRSHVQLAAKSRGLQVAAAAGGASREELTRFLLGEVVADHMLTEDRRFAALFAGLDAR